jgi:hypothetical protein
MITSQDEKQIQLERAYAEEQSRLNREHELNVLDKTLELEKLKIKREYNFFRPIIMLPIRILLILPLTVAAIRKHKVDSILDTIKEW